MSSSTNGTLLSASPYLSSLIKRRKSLAIVGTAGRKEDEHKINCAMLPKMVEIAAAAAQKLGVKELVSGGAAWADHVAVLVFLQDPTKYKLTLHVPAAFEGDRYKDVGGFGASNPGGTANYYHGKFSKAVGRDTIREIAEAIKLGATVIVGKGFFDRNKLVAKSGAILAFTFGDKEWVKDGGTAHTMAHFFDKHPKNPMAFHVDLHTMTTYLPASVEVKTIKDLPKRTPVEQRAHEQAAALEEELESKES